MVWAMGLVMGWFGGSASQDIAVWPPFNLVLGCLGGLLADNNIKRGMNGKMTEAKGKVN